ncbi:uncharacterized protein LTHEOB_1663 [Lasiodiplodia theobromae]|uniref:uncharacterized protein n=1 Tax=Lasiodiplodia theobromae TaxID=45133 RepID=UPI0015C2C3B3|nr:uncharacterized protein LTHEOB_1663 [Lasiodiplodia theobromae]KAF4537472.1 hypothetical protein LTHEOB_1663 [Lasiodiplodia theobromae]
MSHIPSPGNAFTPEVPPMRLPHLEHEYRLIADMGSGYEMPNMRGTGLTRSVGNIAGGTVAGPRITGKVLENSGADWAIRVHSKKIFYQLDARYTVLTDDGHYILVNAKGIFSLGPGVPDTGEEEPTCSQDEVEYFSHLTYEAPGDSPYNWMNSIVAVGVMTMWENKVVIDAYRLTNFPGKEAEDVYVGR